MTNHPLNKPGAYRNRLDGYRAEADTLLAEYGLDVPDAAVEALAKRIMFERFRDDYEAKALAKRILFGRFRDDYEANKINEMIRTGHWKAGIEEILKHRKKEKENESIAQNVHTRKKRERLTERVASAINQTNALLSHKGNGQGHLDKLCQALSDEYLLVELTLCQPRFDLNSDDLERLLHSLIAIRDSPRSRTGRPKDKNALIFMSVIRVWKLAKREIKYSNNLGRLKGAFPDFLKGVYDLCDVHIPSDDAIHSRLRMMLKNHHIPP